MFERKRRTEEAQSKSYRRLRTVDRISKKPNRQDPMCICVYAGICLSEVVIVSASIYLYSCVGSTACGASRVCVALGHTAEQAAVRMRATACFGGMRSNWLSMLIWLPSQWLDTQPDRNAASGASYKVTLFKLWKVHLIQFDCTDHVLERRPLSI